MNKSLFSLILQPSPNNGITQCGGSAFARVSRSWVHEDQTIPSSIAARIVRRADAQPEVRGLALDTDFSKVDPSQ